MSEHSGSTLQASHNDNNPEEKKNKDNNMRCVICDFADAAPTGHYNASLAVVPNNNKVSFREELQKDICDHCWEESFVYYGDEDELAEQRDQRELERAQEDVDMGGLPLPVGGLGLLDGPGEGGSS